MSEPSSLSRLFAVFSDCTAYELDPMYIYETSEYGYVIESEYGAGADVRGVKAKVYFHKDSGEYELTVIEDGGQTKFFEWDDIRGEDGMQELRVMYDSLRTVGWKEVGHIDDVVASIGVLDEDEYDG
jgi:hypothetical protein